MPRGERTDALDRLTEELCRAWTKAGPPSYQHFATRSEEILGRARRLPSSTTQEVLNRHRVKPPPWDWIRRFWTVLQAIAIENGIDPDSLGTLRALEEPYEAACTAYRNARQLAGVTAGPVSGHTQSGAVTGHAPAAGENITGQASPAPTGADVQQDEVLASIRQAIGVEWWHDYDNVVPKWTGPYLSLEPAARLIHSYETAAVPSLLQTQAYARGILRVAQDSLPEAVITRLVQLLLRRQQILTWPNPPRVWAVFDETALRRELGDDMITRTQITHLLELSRLPNVTIQVIPSVTKIRVALGYPITLLRFHHDEMDDVVYLEQLMNAHYLHDPDQVSRYSQVLSGLSAEALQPEATADHLRQILLDT